MKTIAEKVYNFTCSSHRIYVLLRLSQNFVVKKLVRKQGINIHAACVQKTWGIVLSSPVSDLPEAILLVKIKMEKPSSLWWKSSQKGPKKGTDKHSKSDLVWFVA